MKLSPSMIYFASLLSLALAAPSFKNMVLHDSRPSAPAGFTKTGVPSADTIINIRLALTSSDIPGLEAKTLSVSTPGSEEYGLHLTKEEVEEFVKPTQQTVDIVNTWLSANGLTATQASPAGDWLSLSLPISKANTLFSTQFSTFTSHSTGISSIRALSISLPSELIPHIDVVFPGTSFPAENSVKPTFSIPQQSQKRQVASSCATSITPSCLQSLYGIPTTKATQSSNVLGVSGFIEQFANQADLKTFLGKFRTDLSSSTTFTLQTLDGGSNPQSASQAGVEANLDIQYTVGVASGVPTTFISVGENFQDGDLEGFLDIINALLGESNPPHVLTTSYGQNENTISRALANNLCNAYTQLGARGTSILFASGDGGVAGSQTSSCTTFLPTFPSGCPFMTSVGATTGISPEKGTTFSSGGFSNFFARPSYQSSQVAAYLTALGSTNAGKFNTSGRAFPDVAAQGQNVQIVVGGRTGSVAGTSCSSPIFASVIALLNDRLIAAGKSPLGFLNPFLYSAAGTAALNDVTTGNNPGCGTNGFPARAGWDPVTGLGTPNFAKLLTAVGL